jgi:anti-sigma regulatory factor (Ser/Thr protein kinase)
MSQQVALAVDPGVSAADVLEAPFSPVTPRHVRLTALPSAAPWARRVLRHTLREWHLQDLEDSALLLVSELVTDAVKASARLARRDPDTLPMISLTVHITADGLLMEVWDGSSGLPALQEADLTGERGRGLLLVDFLADEWGHYPVDGGKVVWCKVRLRCPRRAG